MYQLPPNYEPRKSQIFITQCEHLQEIVKMSKLSSVHPPFWISHPLASVALDLLKVEATGLIYNARETQETLVWRL